MSKTTLPELRFDRFVLAEIPSLVASNRIYINEEYQRGDIWKPSQKVELIRSIYNGYSIGVLVLFVNDRGQYEILDGQQRLLTIQNYLNGTLDMKDSGLISYSDLGLREKTVLNAYPIFYLKLKNHNPETKEEDVVQTFLRLQEGTPLNKAEKINAYRGAFKDAFRNARETHSFFKLLGKDKRFRLRQLAAEMLLIELEGDFKRKVFPDLDLQSLIGAAKKYEKRIPSGRVRSYLGNLEFLHSSLNIFLTAFSPREAISFYMLVSYLRKHRANNADLHNELSEFCKEFLQNLNSFSIYDEKPPRGMSKMLFQRYKRYKEESKILTTSESLTNRLNIMLSEFERLYKLISKDPKRLHDAEQKRILYFRQKGLCSECGKEMRFDVASAHHVVAHSKGGNTDDLSQATLVHAKCHWRIEKRLRRHGSIPLNV